MLSEYLKETAPEKRESQVIADRLSLDAIQGNVNGVEADLESSTFTFRVQDGSGGFLLCEATFAKSDFGSTGVIMNLQGNDVAKLKIDPSKSIVVTETTPIEVEVLDCKFQGGAMFLHGHLTNLSNKELQDNN